MPRTLKLYITGVVTLSAIALVVATLCFPPKSDCPHIRRRRHPGRHGRRSSRPQLQILAGILFWTLLTLVASAVAGPTPARNATRRRHGPDRRSDVARRPGGRRLGRSSRIDRDAGDPRTDPLVRDRLPITPGRHCRQLSVAWCNVAFLSLIAPPRSGHFAASFVATMIGAAVFFVLNVGNRSGPTRTSYRAVVSIRGLVAIPRRRRSTALPSRPSAG